MAVREKALDLDKLLDNFLAWQKHMGALETKNKELKLELESTKKILTIEQNQSSRYKEDVIATQRLVTQLQETLKKRCDIENENRNLREIIDAKDAEKKVMEKKHEDNLEDMRSTMTDIESSHKAEVTLIQETITRKADQEKVKLEEELALRELEIKELKKQLKEEEKDKQSEILQLTVQFEEKLQKVQKQLAKAQQANQPSNNLNQEIFRKKLQFAKSEYEREIQEHKQMIIDLQQKLHQMSDISPRNMTKEARSFQPRVSLSTNARTPSSNQKTPVTVQRPQNSNPRLQKNPKEAPPPSGKKRRLYSTSNFDMLMP